MSLKRKIERIKKNIEKMQTLRREEEERIKSTFEDLYTELDNDYGKYYQFILAAEYELAAKQFFIDAESEPNTPEEEEDLDF